jgi:hypothetical protein
LKELLPRLTAEVGEYVPVGKAEINIKTLVDWHTEDSLFRPLQDERTYR